MTKSVNSKIKALVAMLLALVMVLSALAGCVKNGQNGISLDVTEKTMYVADTLVLKATAPAGAEITWSSSNESVATVRRGTVSAKAVGNARITASIEGASATCQITVRDRTVTISQTEATINLDTEVKSVTLTASSSDGGAITWSSSNAMLATVSGGVVTATGYDIGDVTITAQRGAATAECVVHIIQPSRPADFRLLEAKNNSGAVDDPGTWFYWADGSGADFTYAQTPWYGGGAVGVTFTDALNPSTGNYFYFRYQPTFGAEDVADEFGMEYVITFTLELSASVEIRYGQPVGTAEDREHAQYNTVKTTKVSANTPKQITYFGAIGTAEPFSIRINAADVSLAGLVFNVTGIEIHARTADDVEPEPEKPEPENPGDVYDLTWGDKGTTVGHPNRWYYMVNSGAGQGAEEIAATPTYNNGVVTLSLSSTTAGKNYQLRYQPDMDYGTLYTVTFTVNVSAQADILAGIDKNNRTFTADDGIVAGQDVTLTLNCVVSYEDPFHIEIANFTPGEAITLVVKDVTFVEREEDDNSYDLTWGGKTDVAGDPDHWYYMINSVGNGANEIISARYEDGTVVLELKNTSATTLDGSAAVFQLRYQPDYAAGTKYTISFTITLTARAWLLVGNDVLKIPYPEGATSGGDQLYEANTTYVITYKGTVDANEPFYIGINAENPGQPIKLTVSDIAVELRNDEDEPGPGPDEPDVSYDLTFGSKGDVSGNPDHWYYMIDGDGVNEIKSVKYVDGVVTMDLKSMLPATSSFQLRYQPKLPNDFKYTIKFTIMLTAQAYLIVGNDALHTTYPEGATSGAGIYFDANQEYQISYTGTIKNGDPFYIQLKAADINQAIKLTVYGVTVEEISEGGDEPTQPKVSYDLVWGSNSDVMGNPDHWYYMINSDGNGANEINSATFVDGVVTLDLKNTAGASAVYQLRYHPGFEVGTTYKVTMTIKLSARGWLALGDGGNGTNKNYPSGASGNASVYFDANQEYAITYYGTVNSGFAFFIQLRTEDSAAPIVLTVSNVEFAECHQLPMRNNADTKANPGEWAYWVDGGSQLEFIPTYDDGVITFALTKIAQGSNCVVRIQPDYPDGTSYTISMKIKIVSDDPTARFVYGYDYQSSRNLTVGEDGYYNVTWTGTISAANISFGIVANTDNYDNPLPITLIICDISIVANQD